LSDMEGKDLQEIRVRDNRPSRFCWQDNELYDVFQPIIGSHAMVVYANLSRLAWGQPKIEIGVRKLATLTGQGEATVWRNVEVLAFLGVLRIEKGKGSAPSVFELCDLKDAAEALGATYHRHRASHVLSESRITELSTAVAALRKKLQGKNDKPAGEVCVSHRNAADEANLAAPDSQRNASVSLRVASVSFDGAPSNVNKKEEQKSPTPTPPQGGVDGKPVAARLEAISPDSFSLLRQQLKKELLGEIPLGKQQHMPKIVQGIEDFEACFDNWWLCRCEQPDGARMPLVVTDSPRPDLTMAGLEKYRKRMERLMTKYFGGLVEIQVVPQKAVS
jgi:hypothetical protein